MNTEIVVKIEQVLNDMRPYILKDGGDITFVSFVDGIVHLKLHGACTHCAMSFYTLKLGIQERLISEVPEVKEVVADN
ncbi:MAG: NifU family protein [Candidatus Babeliaceae bacterium]|jgi:Fe-S cluster biogenesis protein NfuA